jgi:hypothetical protein
MRLVARCNSLLRNQITRPPTSTSSRAPITAARSIGGYHRRTTTLRNSFKTSNTRNMSTESTQSQACCNTPAVVSKGYSPKGDYITVDGLKTCTSPSPPIPTFPFSYNPIPNPTTQTPPAPRTPNSASWSSTTSSASSRRRCRAPTSWPTPTTKSTRSSCPTSSRASPRISRGTRRITTRRARS